MLENGKPYPAVLTPVEMAERERVRRIWRVVKIAVIANLPAETDRRIVLEGDMP